MGYGHTGDLLGISPGMVHNDAHPNFPDLRPLLSAPNLSPSALLSGAVADHQDGSVLRGLPRVVGEWQFYANPPLLGELGVASPPRWTWQAFVDTLARAAGRGSAPSSVLVAGTGWGDANLWGALVPGLGGSLTAGGALDLSGAVAATTRLVSVARGCGWHPDPESNFNNPHWSDFYTGGFSRSAGDALFAFLQPMRIYPGRVPPALRSLPTAAFPRMPARDVVPAYSGLALSPYATDPELATQVLLWLYEPRQQRLLAAHGCGGRGPAGLADAAGRHAPLLGEVRCPGVHRRSGADHGGPADEPHRAEHCGGGRLPGPVWRRVAQELATLQKRLEALIGAG